MDDEQLEPLNASEPGKRKSAATLGEYYAACVLWNAMRRLMRQDGRLSGRTIQLRFTATSIQPIIVISGDEERVARGYESLPVNHRE